MPLQAGPHVLRPSVVAARPAGVAFERLDERLRPVDAVLHRPRRTRQRRCALHAVRETHGPLVRLLRTHRTAEDQRELFDAEVLAQQALLRHDVITDAHPREAALAVGPGEGVRRGAEPAADLVDQHDEPLVRVQRAPWPDVRVAHDAVVAGVPGGDQDGVVLGSVQPSERLVRELAASQRAAVLQHQVADVRKLVRAVHFGAVVRVDDDHTSLPGQGQRGRTMTRPRRRHKDNGPSAASGAGGLDLWSRPVTLYRVGEDVVRRACPRSRTP